MKIGFCVWMAGRRVWVWTTHRANWVMFNHIYINIGYLSLFEVCNYSMWPSCPSSSQHDASPSLCWGQLGRVERGVIWRNRIYIEWWMCRMYSYFLLPPRLLEWSRYVLGLGVSGSAATRPGLDSGEKELCSILSFRIFRLELKVSYRDKLQVVMWSDL